MTTRSVTLQADLDTVASPYSSARTFVGIPPSSVDSIWDEMRVAVNGSIILRAFDPGEPIVTGAPIAYVTMGDEALVTMDGEAYELVVQ